MHEAAIETRDERADRFRLGRERLPAELEQGVVGQRGRREARRMRVWGHVGGADSGGHHTSPHRRPARHDRGLGFETRPNSLISAGHQ
jgi:hypothetical protein